MSEVWRSRWAVDAVVRPTVPCTSRAEGVVSAATLRADGIRGPGSMVRGDR